MPTYQWTGIDLQGQVCRGTQSAASIEKLEKYLFEHDIALLTSKRARSLFRSRWQPTHTIEFFKQIGVLLQSGIFLTDALGIITEQTARSNHKMMLEQIRLDIQNGMMLSECLAQYSDCFDAIVITLIKVGEDTGKLPIMLERLAAYMEHRQAFRQRLHAAAMTPLITLIFFFMIASILLLFVIPQFASLIEGNAQELPQSTQLLLWLSKTMNVYSISVCLSTSIIGFLFFRRWKQGSGKWFWDSCLLRLPFFGNLVHDTALFYLFESSSVLLESGIALPDALKRAQESITNQIIQFQCEDILAGVTRGLPLSQAFQIQPSPLIATDIISIIRIGEESGRLDAMIKRAAEQYHLKISRQLDFLATIFQPALMVFLGLLVTGLVCAVYIPIFELANGIGM